MQDFNERARPRPDHQKGIAQLIREVSLRHSHWQVFTDFVEMAAISLSNAVDLAQREPREARYMEIVRRYKPDELQKFPKMLAELTLALEEDASDVLGRTFHDLDLHNKWASQFFTPDDVCRMMAKMTLGDREGLDAKIAERGFVAAMEPAVGAGAMVIALGREMR